MLQEGLFPSQKIGRLEVRIDGVLRENLELKTQLGRVNRKPKMAKRASMPLTLKGWDAPDTAAHKAKMPKSALLRSVLAGSGTIPALTVNHPDLACCITVPERVKTASFSCLK